jgi:hypothetical protein
VWPSLSNQEIADELLLEVEAGSSGRPNKAAEVANIERITPLLLQIPGVRPDWLVKQLITRLDDRIDPTDAIASGLPSIIAQNVMSKLMGGAQGGPPQEGTESQGGADNEEAPPQGPPPSGPPSSLPQMAGGMPMQ